MLIEKSKKIVLKLGSSTVVDSKGTFRSDDEVGYFFETLKQIQYNLDQFNVPENYAKKEEQS